MQLHFSHFFSAFCLLVVGCFSCTDQVTTKELSIDSERFIMVMGIAQDAGYPQAGCSKSCCQLHWNGEEPRRYASCLAIVDQESKQSWLIEATPDIKDQVNHLYTSVPGTNISGIFLTHAHIGHYTGLMHLGKEVMGTHDMPVYAMPRMENFLTSNGPWNQLVDQNNIKIVSLKADSAISLTNDLTVTPILVPHRDEYSETVGYKIESNKKTILFIPDINKWGAWERNIIAEIDKVDIAFIDGTFYKNGEIPGRDMSQIPHPFIQESMDLFSEMDSVQKSKVHFIHFNHTNPVFRNTQERAGLLSLGFNLAEERQVIPL